MRLSMETNPGTAQAVGWSVHEYPAGTWSWSAYGPRGGDQGRAPSKAKAETRAKRSADNLRLPEKPLWA